MTVAELIDLLMGEDPNTPICIVSTEDREYSPTIYNQWMLTINGREHHFDAPVDGAKKILVIRGN